MCVSNCNNSKKSVIKNHNAPIQNVITVLQTLSMRKSKSCNETQKLGISCNFIVYVEWSLFNDDKQTLLQSVIE